MLAAALAAPAFLVGCGSSRSVATTVETTVRTTTVTTTAPAAAGPVASMADVAARVLPGVVNIQTAGFDGSRGEASGVVIDRSGVIVTNHHVVEGARTVRVAFNDGRHERPVPAEVVGTASERDLAIVRVRFRDLVPVRLGRSSRLRLGDPVLAVGFPLGLGGPTVTQGIVSGLDRTIQASSGPPLEGLLQTDAAINPGNSGGALVDAAGRLVGINTVGARAGAAENVGFAISIDSARAVIDEIRSTPPDRRPWLGVSLETIDSAADAVQLGVPPDTRGAVVVAVFGGSPAARAGVREGDVVISIDAKTVRSTADVAAALKGRGPGDRVTLELVDPSGPRRVVVRVGKRPATLGG